MHSTSIFRCIMTMIFDYTIFFIFQIFVFKFFSANIIKCFFFQMIPVALLLITFFKKKLVLFIACSFKNHQNFFIQPLPLNTSCLFYILLFSVRVFFHRYWRLSGQQGKGGDHFLLHSTSSTRSWTLRHLQLRMWDDYHIFLIAPLLFTRLLLNGIYHFIKLPFHWLMMWGFYISFSLQQSWYEEPVDSNLHQLSPLYYKWTD